MRFLAVLLTAMSVSFVAGYANAETKPVQSKTPEAAVSEPTVIVVPERTENQMKNIILT